MIKTMEILFPPKIKISWFLKDLLTKLLEKYPFRRLGAKGGISEIRAQRWFNDVDFDKIYTK